MYAAVSGSRFLSLAKACEWKLDLLSAAEYSNCPGIWVFVFFFFSLQETWFKRDKMLINGWLELITVTFEEKIINL